ncbi:MAG: TVP38/TMEM64 family protein [Chloroflexi bacterium]|nr:TVP38/TMEM64 family protein [Chloroflexota bacterium]
MSEQRGSRWTWRHTACLVALLAAIGGALYHWREPLWALLRDQERVQQWVAGFGPWAPLVSIALNTAQVLLAPIPGQFVGVMNGYLYGIWLGTLYSMIGLLIGTALATALGRWFGRPLVERLVNPEQLARWDRITHRRGPPFFFLIFLFPSLPDDIVCFLIGLSPLAIPRMLVLAMIGRLPGVFVSCWIGANASELPWWAWIPLGGGAAALAWAFWRYQARLETAMVYLIQKLTVGVPQASAAPTSGERQSAKDE